MALLHSSTSSGRLLDLGCRFIGVMLVFSLSFYFLHVCMSASLAEREEAQMMPVVSSASSSLSSGDSSSSFDSTSTMTEMAAAEVRARTDERRRYRRNEVNNVVKKGHPTDQQNEHHEQHRRRLGGGTTTSNSSAVWDTIIAFPRRLLRRLQRDEVPYYPPWMYEQYERDHPELADAPPKEILDIEKDECYYGNDVYAPCQTRYFPQCNEQYEMICYNRRPRKDKFYTDNRQPYFYIDYRNVKCYPILYSGCSSCTPGRYCLSEHRCILDDIGYPCANWL